MIIHWRAHLNSVQNAVGSMVKPTMPMFFSGPSAVSLSLDVGDILSVSDGIAFGVGLGLSDTSNISDSTQLVIPSWLRALRIGDIENYIIIKRIR